MNLEIVSKQPNALMGRTDVAFSCSFDGGIPPRKEVRAALSAALSTPAERIVVVNIATTSGQRTVQGMAHVYEKPEQALKDSKHLLLRDGLVSKEAKKAAAPAAKAK